MPITAKQFELGIDSVIEGWMRRIHEFLALHRQEAFSPVELAMELDGFLEQYKIIVQSAKARGQKLWLSYIDNAFIAALDKLVEVGALEYRTIRGERYYALGPAPLPL